LQPDENGSPGNGNDKGQQHAGRTRHEQLVLLMSAGLEPTRPVVPLLHSNSVLWAQPRSPSPAAVRLPDAAPNNGCAAVKTQIARRLRRR